MLYFNGGNIMDALQTVFTTIMQVIEMIKAFLAELFPAKEEAPEATPEA